MSLQDGRVVWYFTQANFYRYIFLHKTPQTVMKNDTKILIILILTVFSWYSVWTWCLYLLRSSRFWFCKIKASLRRCTSFCLKNKNNLFVCIGYGWWKTKKKQRQPKAFKNVHQLCGNEDTYLSINRASKFWLSGLAKGILVPWFQPSSSKSWAIYLGTAAVCSLIFREDAAPEIYIIHFFTCNKKKQNYYKNR